MLAAVVSSHAPWKSLAAVGVWSHPLHLKGVTQLEMLASLVGFRFPFLSPALS